MGTVYIALFAVPNHHTTLYASLSHQNPFRCALFSLVTVIRALPKLVVQYCQRTQTGFDTESRSSSKRHIRYFEEWVHPKTFFLLVPPTGYDRLLIRKKKMDGCGPVVAGRNLRKCGRVRPAPVTAGENYWGFYDSPWI